MATVLPFQAITPKSGYAPQISSLPYDVMNREEAKEMAAATPLNFLHVTRSEIDLPPEINAYDAQVYAKAKENWEKIRNQFMAKDGVPSFYVYSQVMNGRRQTGIVATPLVKEYDANIIKKHETTRKEKEDDRTRHISTLRAQTGPVFLTYRDSAEIQKIMDDTMKNAPLFDFTAEDGISHAGWRVPQELTAQLQKAFEAVPYLYIADGHHRAASASRTGAALKDSTNPGESDRFVAVIFPAGQLKILPYNRVLADLNSLTAEEFLVKLGQVVKITENGVPSPAKPGECSLYLAGKWYGIELPLPSNLTAIDVLDVSRLQNYVLGPILGIDDPRISKRIDFVGGIRGTKELVRLVDSGKAQAAFSMFATTLDQLMNIAEAGAIMPPKSTWFEPKLRDGLFVHEI